MTKDFTKVYDENARLKEENTKLKAELKGKDELLFAYESVRAPVNPLLAKNVTFKEFVRHVIKVHCWGIEEIDGFDTQDKAVELGLIEAHIATEEDVNPEFDEYEVGDTIYRFSDMLKGVTDDVQDESI